MKDIVRLMVLFLMGHTFYRLLSTGTISYYINPRFIPLTEAAFVFIVIMILFSLKDLITAFGTGDLGSWRGAPVFVLIAIATTLLFTPQALGSSMIGQKGTLAVKSKLSVEKLEQNSAASNNTAASSGEATAPGKLNKEKAVQAASDSGNIISLTDANFIVKFSQIHRHIDEYRGKDIELEGFIAHHPLMSEDKYLVARYAVVCCAADAQVLSFAVKGKAPHADDTWVKVTGKLQVEAGNPYLQVIKMETKKTPANPYLFAPEGLPTI